MRQLPRSGIAAAEVTRTVTVRDRARSRSAPPLRLIGRHRALVLALVVDVALVDVALAVARILVVVDLVVVALVVVDLVVVALVVVTLVVALVVARLQLAYCRETDQIVVVVILTEVHFGICAVLLGRL